MNDKKLGYETDLMGLPPLRLVLGDRSYPDPDRQQQAFQEQQQKLDRDMESTVKRLIAYLKENEK